MTILRGHAVDLFPGLSGGLDLVVTDPPYAFGGGGAEHELSATVAVALRECAVRLNRDRHMLVFCASSWRSISYMVESLRGLCVPARVGTWVKPASRTKVATAGWKWASVSVVVFKKGRPEAPTSASLDHVLAEPVKNGRRAQLPQSVCDWAVAPYAVPGGTFLDPFAGSGALVQAAERAGMRATGFEIQE
jgi:DNA modification methylase